MLHFFFLNKPTDVKQEDILTNSLNNPVDLAITCVFH